MITYWLALNTPHFHPSVLGVAPTPTGPAVSPGFRKRRLWGPASRLSFRTNLGFMALLVLPLFGYLMMMAFTPHKVFWAILAAGHTPLCLTLGQLDRVFWLIRRAHDTGKSWLWVFIPVLMILIGFAVAIGALMTVGRDLAYVISTGMLFGMVFPGGLLLLWLTFGQSQDGENRYGSPPDPIPDYWFD